MESRHRTECTTRDAGATGRGSRDIARLLQLRRGMEPAPAAHLCAGTLAIFEHCLSRVPGASLPASTGNTAADNAHSRSTPPSGCQWSRNIQRGRAPPGRYAAAAPPPTHFRGASGRASQQRRAVRAAPPPPPQVCCAGMGAGSCTVLAPPGGVHPSAPARPSPPAFPWCCLQSSAHAGQGRQRALDRTSPPWAAKCHPPLTAPALELDSWAGMLMRGVDAWQVGEPAACGGGGEGAGGVVLASPDRPRARVRQRPPAPPIRCWGGPASPCGSALARGAPGEPLGCANIPCPRPAQAPRARPSA